SGSFPPYIGWRASAWGPGRSRVARWLSPCRNDRVKSTPCQPAYSHTRRSDRAAVRARLDPPPRRSAPCRRDTGHTKHAPGRNSDWRRSPGGTRAPPPPIPFLLRDPAESGVRFGKTVVERERLLGQLSSLRTGGRDRERP